MKFNLLQTFLGAWLIGFYNHIIFPRKRKCRFSIVEPVHDAIDEDFVQDDSFLEEDEAILSSSGQPIPVIIGVWLIYLPRLSRI